MKYTVLGSTGFIGSHLARHLRDLGAEVYTPMRGELLPKEKDLGHIFYCIGLNGSLAGIAPFEMVLAHVCLLLDILKNTQYQSFLYLSSTRVYSGIPSSEEEAPLTVHSLDPNDFYSISKLTGESTCLSVNRPSVRVIRLASAYGRDFASSNFLPVMIREALTKKRIVLQSDLNSEKDYVSIEDVVGLLPRIAESGRHRVYNVASGSNVSHRALMSRLADITGCLVEVQKGSETVAYPPIQIERIKKEFDFCPQSVLTDLPNLVAEFQTEFAL